MKAQLQLILATIGLTILIWVYADQQGYRAVEFPVAINVTTLPGYVPRVAGATDPESPQTINVMVLARGPNAIFRELNLRSLPVLQVSVLVADNITLDAPRAIDLREPLTAALRDKGLQLAGVRPQIISVRFDRREKIKLEVQADVGAFAEALKGSLQIEPPTVTAGILSSDLRNAPGTLENRLVIPIEDQLRAQPAQTEFDFTISLKDKKWQGISVNWDPEVIRVRGRLQRLYEDLELKLIPLRILLPWDWPCDQYQVVWVDERDRLQKIRLKVPVGKPNVLTSADVIAQIFIDESLIPPESPAGPDPASQPAAEPSPFSQTVRFVFPPGFEDAKIVSPPSVVKFRIVKRTPAEQADKKP
jgi:hypothetical protein